MSQLMRMAQARAEVARALHAAIEIAAASGYIDRAAWLSDSEQRELLGQSLERARTALARFERLARGGRDGT